MNNISSDLNANYTQLERDECQKIIEEYDNLNLLDKKIEYLEPFNKNSYELAMLYSWVIGKYNLNPAQAKRIYILYL